MHNKPSNVRSSHGTANANMGRRTFPIGFGGLAAGLAATTGGGGAGAAFATAGLDGAPFFVEFCTNVQKLIPYIRSSKYSTAHTLCLPGSGNL
jgi:hypothetical protein